MLIDTKIWVFYSLNLCSHQHSARAHEEFSCKSSRMWIEPRFFQEEPKFNFEFEQKSKRTTQTKWKKKVKLIFHHLQDFGFPNSEFFSSFESTSNHAFIVFNFFTFIYPLHAQHTFSFISLSQGMHCAFSIVDSFELWIGCSSVIIMHFFGKFDLFLTQNIRKKVPHMNFSHKNSEFRHWYLNNAWCIWISSKTKRPELFRMGSETMFASLVFFLP